MSTNPKARNFRASRINAVCCFLYSDIASANCKRTQLGQEYVGTVSETKNGLPCQRWDSQVPHTHDYQVTGSFPDATVSDANNYCRNPDGNADGPWCLTRDPDVREELCDIPVCQGIVPYPYTSSIVNRWKSRLDVARCSENGMKYKMVLSSSSVVPNLFCSRAI